MVVFTCNHCGESVHKPSVEKHYNSVCRKYKDLTCVDCFKDFRGEEFAVHTKCLTEDERYAAKGSMPIGVQKKGEVKQEAWVDMIRSIIQEDINMKPQNKNLLLTISKHNNVPRKRQKFLNYIKSATGARVSENTISEVWDIIEAYKEKHAKLDKTKEENGNKENNLNSETNEINNEENIVKKKSKKNKRKDVDDSIEITSPKKKSKKEKSKAAEVIEPNSLETSMPNKKRKQKQNGIDAEQMKNGTLEKNDKLEENSNSKKKKPNVIENNESSLNGIGNEENNLLKTDKKKKKKNKNTANGDNVDLEIDISVSEINESNDLTQLDESSLVETNQDNGTSFIIEDVILNILNKKNEISIQKLEKKVTTKYMKHTKETEVSQKFVKKIHKKLRKCEKVEITEDNIVKLK